MMGHYAECFPLTIAPQQDWQDMQSWHQLVVLHTIFYQFPIFYPQRINHNQITDRWNSFKIAESNPVLADR